MGTETGRAVALGTAEVLAEGITFEEFIQADWLDPHCEWVAGKVVRKSRVTDEHQNVAGFVQALLRCWVEHHGIGVVQFEPFQVRLGPDGPTRAPDVMFIATGHLDRLTPTYLDGPPDLIVEVISPGSRAVDRGEKFYEYERAGVPEYWLLDPERRVAEFYQLDEAGVYRTTPIGADDRYHSRTLAGLWLQVGWLWDRPTLLDVLRDWEFV